MGHLYIQDILLGPKMFAFTVTKHTIKREYEKDDFKLGKLYICQPPHACEELCFNLKFQP